jgi:hypothetical protein
LMADTQIQEMRERTFDIGKGIKLQFNEHNVPIPDREFVAGSTEHRRKFTVTLKVDSGEVFSMDHYIYTRDLDATVENIGKIIACLKDDTPTEIIVESLKKLLRAKHALCGKVATCFEVELDVAEHLKDFYSFSQHIPGYIMGDTRVKLEENPGEGYSLIEFPHSRKNVSRVYISLFNKKLMYFFTTPMIPRPKNEHYTKYKAVDMDTFDTESPLQVLYCGQFQEKPEIYFLPGIKRVHIEGTDLVILRKILGTLEIYIPNMARDLILENTNFQFEGILYCAVHQRIQLHTNSHGESCKMIDYLNGVLGPDSNEKWENIERVMNQRHRMHVFPDSTFKDIFVMVKSPELKIEDQEKISSFLVGDDTPYIMTENGSIKLKYFKVRGNYKEAIINWTKFRGTVFWNVIMDVMKKNEYAEINISLNDLSDSDPPLSIPIGLGGGLTSKFNSRKEYLYTTLQVLNHLLDKPL